MESLTEDIHTLADPKEIRGVATTLDTEEGVATIISTMDMVHTEVVEGTTVAEGGTMVDEEGTMAEDMMTTRDVVGGAVKLKNTLISII